LECSIAFADGADVVVLRLKGELDGSTVDRFREEVAEAAALAQRQGCDLVVDLRRVAFIGLVGLYALTDEAHRLRSRDRRLLLRSPSAMVMRTLQITGLDGHLPVCPGHPAVRESVSPDPHRG
jgi:anti-anti-sigma factor